MIVGVLLPLPFNDVFDYQVEGDVVLGEMVRVSFGREVLVGVVWKLGKNSDLPLADPPETNRNIFPFPFPAPKGRNLRRLIP